MQISASHLQQSTLLRVTIALPFFDFRNQFQIMWTSEAVTQIAACAQVIAFKVPNLEVDKSDKFFTHWYEQSARILSPQRVSRSLSLSNALFKVLCLGTSQVL